MLSHQGIKHCRPFLIGTACFVYNRFQSKGVPNPLNSAACEEDMADVLAMSLAHRAQTRSYNVFVCKDAIAWNRPMKEALRKKFNLQGHLELPDSRPHRVIL